MIKQERGQRVEAMGKSEEALNRQLEVFLLREKISSKKNSKNKGPGIGAMGTKNHMGVGVGGPTE